MIKPHESYGKAAYDAIANDPLLLENGPWEDLSPGDQEVFLRAAMAAIEAYDAQLTAEADAYAEKVAAVPTFAERVAQAQADAVALRPDGWISR